MASYRPKVFTRPDGLRRIANVHLIALLEPWRDYFRGRSFEFPTDPEEKFPHQHLASKLLAYDDGMPVELMNALYYIDLAASKETLDQLLERAAEHGIRPDTRGDPTPADIAVQIYLSEPKLLEERAVSTLAQDRSAFTYYFGRSLPSGLPPITDEHRARMVALIDPWLEKRHRGRGARVFHFRHASTFWLVVRHGMPMVREGKHEDNGEPGAAFYRPQKHDVMIYDAINGILGVNASSKGERDLLRKTLGSIVFGSESHFLEGNVFTLDPLRREGPSALECSDITGINSVRLLELVRTIRGSPGRVEIHKSSNLFAAWGERWQHSLARGRLSSATFGLVFDDSKKQRTVTLRLDGARYQHDLDAVMIEAWLRARGFYNVTRD